MSRTYRQAKPDNNHYRNPHTQNERRQLNGLIADARLNDCRISPSNRLSRTIPTNYDDIKVSSYAEIFFND